MAARPKDGREKRICVAQIGAPHGLRGEVRLFSFTERPEDFAAYGLLFSEDGRRRLKVLDARPVKDHFLVRFQGIDDRDAAAMLRNMNLYVARNKLPEPQDGETYYHADLVGLAAFDGAGKILGHVSAIHNFGAGDLIEIEPPTGHSIMLPFTDSVVIEIDLGAGRMVLNLPAEAPDGTPAPDRDD